MHLTDTEKKMVERLKKRQQSLKRWRLVGLLGAFGNIGVGCYGIFVLEHFLREPDLPAALAAAFLIPSVYVVVCTGVGLAVYILLHWNGKAETLLLLRLIEDSHDDA